MEAVRSLFLESFISNYKKLGLTEEDLGTNDIKSVLNDYWNDEVKMINNQELSWMVAKKGNEIVGYVSFNLKNAPNEVFIQLLFVKTQMQNQGIGKKLLNSIFSIEKGIKKVSLITRRANSSAIAFYKSHGFNECPLDKKSNIDPALCIQLTKRIQNDVGQNP